MYTQPLREDRKALEMRLLDLSYKTERGCKLTSADRAETEQIVITLESFASTQPAQVCCQLCVLDP